jgi:DNA-binding Lrp family transcriptional regulator
MDLSELSPEERARWELYATTGLHAFLFVDHVAGDRTLREIVDELQGLIPYEGEPSAQPVVLSAAEFVGPYKAFVHLWAPTGDLAGLQDFIAGTLWDLGVRCDYATQGTPHLGPGGVVYPLKIKKCDVVAVVRIWVEKGCASDVMQRLEDLAGFQGAATVFGTFDVILVLEGEDFQSVAKVALGPLQRIPGVVRTETAFADYRRYPDEQLSHKSSAKKSKKSKDS